MNVNGIGSLATLQALDNDADDATTRSAAGATPATQASVSSLGDLMQKLSDLSKSDPDKFKQVMTEVADKLRAQASQASGHQADFLNKLADKFAQAGQTGDLSALQPSGEARGHQHQHRHHGAYAAQGQQQPSLQSVLQSALADVLGASGASGA